METGKLKVEIGEKFANCMTGRVYRVGLINKEWVVLESEDGSSQVLTGRGTLGSLYRQVDHRVDGRGEVQFKLGTRI
jgi:hypothetical protein